MRSTAVTTGEVGDKDQYNLLRKDAQAASYLLAHEQDTPDMTLRVEDGVCSINGTVVEFSADDSPTFTAPVSNNRIDVLSIDDTGTLNITQGVSGASPSAPTIPANEVAICYVYLRSTTTALFDADGGSITGYILTDLRPFLSLPSAGGGTDNWTVVYNNDGSIDTLTDDDTAVTLTLTWSGGRLASYTDGTSTWTLSYTNNRLTSIVKT